MVALALLPPALLACGTKWGRQYVLAESGSHDCSGCGEAIDSYEACGEAAKTGAAVLRIGGLGPSENWGGPPGCHIQDGSNFQWNANAYGDRAAGHTQWRGGRIQLCVVGWDADGLPWVGSGGADLRRRDWADVVGMATPPS